MHEIEPLQSLIRKHPIQLVNEGTITDVGRRESVNPLR
jgi:hypothetical protein